MRVDLFEELAPLCPRCLHGARVESPLVVAERCEERGGMLWHGILHCSNRSCWMEFPVIDGVPVIVPEPPTFLSNSRAQILARNDLPAVLESVIGDACGAGSDYDTARQHLSLYAGSHFADWTGEDGLSPVADIMARLHAIPIDDTARAFLDRPEHGSTPLEQHLRHQRWYYEWAREGVDYPIIEEALDWLEANRPANDPVGIRLSLCLP